jgi:transglutaminase-like putative cysteine protease
MSRVFRIAKAMSLLLATVMIGHQDARVYALTLKLESHQLQNGAGTTSLPQGLSGNRFDTLLAELKEVVSQGEAKTKAAPELGFADITKLTDLKESLIGENEKIEEYFDQLESVLKQKRLPAEILNRHAQEVREYETKYTALMTHLGSIESAHESTTGMLGKLTSKLTGQKLSINWNELTSQTLSFLEANIPAPRRAPLDPRNLPHRSLKPDQAIAPKLTRDEWLKAFPSTVGDARANSIAVRTSGKKKPVSAGATAPPTPDDLAETVEVKFTLEIRQLADSLERNPVKIFNWVRNNIEFTPTWGSIQGAQLCLETKICNAFDTASLLISLFRHSGVPARYQMGTIELPIEKARNWLGGFTDARAAARFAASGGIPSAGTVEQGGVLRSIRLEHVWVSAYLDYIPSQGAVQFEGDTWVSLDASFKLYDRVVGEDLASRLGFNIGPVLQHLDNTTTFDSTNASITNVDTAFIDRTYLDLSNKLKLTFPSGDHRPAFPAPIIRKKDLPIVGAALPYGMRAQGPAFSTLPPSLRHSLTLWLGDDLGNRFVEFQTSLPEIAGKPLALLYEPATQADTRLIQAAVPDEFIRDPAPETLVSRIMERIPAHLVNVRPVIQVNGITTAAGEPTAMGRMLTLHARFDAPTVTTPTSTLSTVTWGRYGITLDLAGVSSEGLRSKVARYQELARQLQATTNRSLVANIPHELVVLSWFNQVDELSQLLGRAGKLAFARYPSLGFSYSPQSVTQTLGVVTRVNIDGFIIDIARQFHVVSALGGDTAVEAAYNLQIGFLSSLLEGLVTAKFFNGPNSTLTGISTSSALSAAAEQRIPIHLLHKFNLEASLPLLDDGYDKDSIRDWVNAGRGVLVAQRPPTVDGHLISGYAAIDLATGDGAFIVNEARAGWLKLLCPNEATEFRQCAPWFVTAVDLLFLVTASFLIAVLLEALLFELLALTALALAIIPPSALAAVLLAGFGLLSVAGCTDAILRANPFSCVKDILRFVYFWRTGTPAPF